MILGYTPQHKNKQQRGCIHTVRHTTHQQYIRTPTVHTQVNNRSHTQQHTVQPTTTVKRKNLQLKRYPVLYVHSYIINYRYAQTLIEKLL